VAITGPSPYHTVTSVAPVACCYHTLAELYASLFAATSWSCQLSFCLCFYCPFFLTFLLYFVYISKQPRVTLFLNQNFFRFCVTA
jgi:hypothetical protein